MDHENGPLVTAVIPVYNHEKYVAESIRSIIHQTYSNVELIVINDGSRDRSHEIVLSLMEKCNRRFSRFEYINRENRGLSATLNQAIGMAKGKYSSALASDDVALPEKFSLLVAALESSGENVAAAFGNALFIDDSGQQVFLGVDEQTSRTETSNTFNNYLDFRTNRGKVFDYRNDSFGSFPSLLQHNYLPAMSNIVRTHLIRDAGGWTKGNASEDWEIWRKLAKQFKFIYVDKPVALYRWHETNSVKTMSGALKYCSFLLVAKEKRYCEEHGMIAAWREAYVELLLPLLMEKQIPLSRKIRSCDFQELLSLSPYLAHRAFNRFARAIRSRG